jgi:hypothetical protein
MKFRKKPVVIEAEQFFHSQDPDTYPVDVEWSGELGAYVIPTLEGQMIIKDGDWIITGVIGEKYLCKPDIFEATYELFEQDAIAIGT